MNIKHGVPQGSVLGPLLFLIYINDLYKSLIYSTAYHFADDTNLLVVSKTQKQLQKHMNIDLKLLYKWLIANKISLNCAKTELIVFNGSSVDKNFEYKIKINGHKLIPTNNLKYLGVLIDNKLNGEYHCEALRGKLNRANGMLSKVRHYVPEKELKSIYHAIFTSHLRYGCQIWALENTAQVERIGKLQDRAMRIINFKNYHTTSEPIYFQYQTLKLCDMVRLNNCLLVYDFLRNTLPECFVNYFEQTKFRYTTLVTRNSEYTALYVPSVNKTSTGIHTITFRSIQSWNSICKTLAESLSKNLPKKDDEYLKLDLTKLDRIKLKKILTGMFLGEMISG